MAMIARILGVSLFTSVLVGVIGLAVLDSAIEQVIPTRDAMIAFLFFACVGGMIGAVAGAAREIVAAQRRKPSDWPEIK